MNVGDMFFTIAYKHNTRVIKVEIIKIMEIDEVIYIHFQDIEDNFDRWFLPIETVEQWQFETRELAENRLKEFK
jgi:hypothetical protein